MNKTQKQDKKEQYLIPNKQYKYQFSIHLKPTSTKDLLFTTKHYSPNEQRDKRYNIDYLTKYISPAIKNYMLDYLNPNRSQKHYFDLIIVYERDSNNKPYHLHLGLTEVDNKCFFINKRTRSMLEEVRIYDPVQLTEDYKIMVLEHIIRNIMYTEDKWTELKQIVFNSKRAVDIRVKNDISITRYLSKFSESKEQDHNFGLGVDYKNSILIPADLRKDR